MTYEEFEKEFDEDMERYEKELKEEEEKYFVDNCAGIDLESSLRCMKKNFAKLPSTIILDG